jgi:4-amino-4-deoxy-L-arabinose transferase-like glycosyltransferase
LLLPWALDLLGGETEVTIVRAPQSVYAEVNGTKLEIPADKLTGQFTGALSQQGISELLSVGRSDTSLYWQPAQPNVFGFLGGVGEWLQRLRPGARLSRIGSDFDQAIGEYRGHFRLSNGRGPATITLVPQGDARNAYQFVIRAERRNIAWWRAEGSLPVEELASGIYRPTGRVSLRDMAVEVLLVAAAAAVLFLLAWLARLLAKGTSGFEGSNLQTFQPSNLQTQSRPWTSGRGYLAPLALFLAGTVVAGAACLLVLDGIPHVQDDVAYLFQGRVFAMGRSWVPVPPGPEFFANGFVEMFEGRWFSKYPPGYPLLLVPVLWAGLPWLANALSAGVALALVYAAGRRMYGLHVATWAGLLGLLSPWVIFMSASYMSHPTTMMWAALFMYALVRMRDDHILDFGRPEGTRILEPRQSEIQTLASGYPKSKIGWPLLAGIAIGMAFITREWTALGIGVGGVLWALGDIALARGRARPAMLGRYALIVVGFLPPLLFLLYENRQLTGDWLRFAQDLVGSYDRPGFGPGHGDAVGHTPALGVYNALVYLRTLATVFDGWPAPLALAPLMLGLFAWVGEKDRRRLAWDLLLWLLTLGLVGAYFLWWSSTTIFGPRYWYEAMPFLLLLAGRGLDLLGRAASAALEPSRAALVRWAAPGAVVGLLSLYNVTQTLPYQVRLYEDYNGISAAAIRNAEGANLKNALVFVELDPAKPNRDYGKVFFANDPLLRGDRVYARDLGAERNRGLAGLFPGRTPFWLPLDGPPVPGFGPPGSK